MIRIIIHTAEDLDILRTREVDPLKFDLIKIPEMVDNTFLILCHRDMADLIEAELSTYEILGSWNDAGEFFNDDVDAPEKEDKEPKKEGDKFKKLKYKAKLRKKLVFANENDTEGTLVDAPEDTMVMNISGWRRIKIDLDEI